MKLSKEELIELIKQEAIELKKEMLEEADAVAKTEDPLKAKMNQNDGLEDSSKALAYKDTTKKVEKEGSKPADVKMNQKDNDQGSDEDAAVAVKVDAGAKKGGKGHTAGQANANFTSKKEIQNTDASGPFDDRVSDNHDIDMNKEDKLVDEKAKTYVAAGSEKGGKTHTAGQHKAEVHERMPEKDAKEPTDRIAKGIEIDGSNVSLKESYTKKELKSFIMEQAKLAAEAHVETQKKEARKSELMEEFKTICEGLAECGVEMEEDLDEIFKGIGQKLGLKDSPEVIAGRKKKIDEIVAKAKAGGFKVFNYGGKDVDEATFNAQMEKNGYTGRITAMQGKIRYTPGSYGAGRLGAGGASQGLGV